MKRLDGLRKRDLTDSRVDFQPILTLTLRRETPKNTEGVKPRPQEREVVIRLILSHPVLWLIIKPQTLQLLQFFDRFHHNCCSERFSWSV